MAAGVNRLLLRVFGGVGVTPMPIASGAGDVQGVTAATGLRLMGFSITEDAGTPAAARLILKHGTGTGDPTLFDVKLAADGVVREWFGPEGIEVPNGVFVDRNTGTTKLTLFTKAVT